jgi:hypothetical protein
MFVRRCVAACVLVHVALTAAYAEERETLFSDDFSSYKTEADLGGKWSNFSGHWFVQDGVLHQDAGGYDCGLVVKDLYLRCDYRIEARVQLVGGGAGAGLYWNVADQTTGDSGHMLRYDGNKPIMYGWMHGRGFLGTGGATGDLYPDGKWHTIRMDVWNTKGTFDVYWDGKKIADAAPQYHRRGYVGLECSMGHSAFDDVQISVAKGTDWRATPRGDVRPEWVASVAVLPDGNLVYPVRDLHRIQIVTPEGKLVREFGERGAGPGQLDRPIAVAVDAKGLIYVTEAGNKRVQVFDATGKSVKVFAPTGDAALQQPYGVAVDAKGLVWVADQSRNRLICLSEAAPNGERVPGGESNRARHVSPINGKLYVAYSNDAKSILIIDPATPDLGPNLVALLQAPKCVAFNGKDTFAVAADTLLLFDKDWKPLPAPAPAAYGDISPDAVAFDAKGNLIVADGWNSRIVVLGAGFGDEGPRVTDVKPDSAVVTWKTSLPRPTKLALLDRPVGATLPPAVDWSAAPTFGDGQMATEHRIELKGLKPATRYAYAVASPARTIPDAPFSPVYRFSTAAPAGQMTYTEAPLAILCYTNVTLEGQKKPDGSPADALTHDDAWLAQVKRSCEAMRYFYWTNTYFRLDTKCHYYPVTRPVDVAYLNSSSEELARDLEALAKRDGMAATDFGAVLVMGGGCCFAYPWPTPWWGGKLSFTTGCCFPAPDTWLSTHEFHHLTEGWMSMVGYPSRFGQTEGYASADGPWWHKGRFGENYDFLAHSMRVVPKHVYLSLAVGVLKTTADADGDGVPDDDANVIFDEKRGGTQTNTDQSYGNGLTDLQNLTAEIFNPASKDNKNPLRTKQVDLKYPFAVIDYAYDRPRKTPTIDGKFTPGEWTEFASTPNAITPYRGERPWGQAYPPIAGADYHMTTYLNWDDDNLYFAMRAPFKFGTSIELDCAADGYFHGKDNPRMGFQIPRDEKTAAPNTLLPPPGVMVWNNVEPVARQGVPDWDNALFDTKDKIRWAWGQADGQYVLEVAIPKCTNVGLVPAEGQEMGVRWWMQGLLPATEKDPDPRYAFEMFDSCEYGYFRLVK